MSGIPNAFLCPITTEMMQDPVVLGDTGHSFERSAIQHWLSIGGQTNPVTGIALNRDTHLIPNHQLRQAIEQFQATREPHIVTLQGLLQLRTYAAEKIFWHGTTEQVAQLIQAHGHLTPSGDGFSGPGVYLTRNKEKAKAWARFAAAGRPCFDRLGNNRRQHFLSSSRPALVHVSVPVHLTCKLFDMSEICDSEFWYETYHRGEIDEDMRPSGNWSGDFLEEKDRPSCFSIVIKDELGRLEMNDKADWGWFRKENGLSKWIEEGFDAQYTHEMNPRDHRDRFQPFPSLETIKRMRGDELVLREGRNARYVAHEVF